MEKQPKKVMTTFALPCVSYFLYALRGSNDNYFFGSSWSFISLSLEKH